MIRGLLKLIVLLVVVVVVGAFLLGYDANDFRGWRGAGDVTASGGAAKAREVGAQIGEKTAAAADAARLALEDGRLTTKIKAKMALDDTVKALSLDVDTRSGVVTVAGSVASQAERQRALALARETEGVRQVIDKLEVR